MNILNAGQALLLIVVSNSVRWAAGQLLGCRWAAPLDLGAHAYVPMPVDMVTAVEYSRPDITERIEAHARAGARAGFDRVLRGTTIPRARRHLVGRHPINAIVEVARDVRSAILVMGAISRSGLKRVFIGNTAERILDQLTCDVLVVKPPRFASKVARAKRGARLIALPQLPRSARVVR